MGSPRLPGVLCLEGDWDVSPESRLSVEPALRLLERNEQIKLIRRGVSTRGELEHHVDTWLSRGLKDYDFAFLGFHGSARTLYLGDVELSLDDLADIIDGRGAGKVLYLASCKVMAAEADVLQEFCARTGIKGLVGYTRNVNWIEAAAFELLLVSTLTRSKGTRIKPAYDRIVRKYPDMSTRLGLRMSHLTWTSDTLPRR
ncbi:DUF6642 family protein [Rhodococcoides kroppenstedtii]|uniref:DUF6642 family protein n=1 Tax=Rhodococcoides kroppenstedtii TaxID=293050 RepID=UPI0028E6E382|nr:DUF6642 family protein [Rhodococcus kroppenstedtii]